MGDITLTQKPTISGTANTVTKADPPMWHLQLNNPFPFRMVKEGRGGTFAFRKPTPSDHASEDHLDENYKDREAILRIGTYACRTCVAFYYKIDDERCFMAHIDAYVIEPGSTATPPEDRLISLPEGEALQGRLLTALESEARRNGWKPEAGHTAVICCPQQSLNGRILTGQYVIEAIREFLGGVKLVELEGKDGFLVHQETGTVQGTFDYDENAIPGFPPRPVGLGFYWTYEEDGQDWSFEVRRRGEDVDF